MENSKKLTKRIIAPIFIILVLFLGIFFGTQIMILTFASDKESIHDDYKKPIFSINESGQTYGFTSGVRFEDFPDLMAAEATNGKQGYIYVSDWLAIKPSFSDGNKKDIDDLTFIAISVYESDGKTIIGEYLITIN